MYQIRSSIFETNSSSTHSICITSDRRNLSIPEKLTFRCDSFGWSWCELRTPEDKAAYLYASMLSLYPREKVNKMTAKIIDALAEEGVVCKFEKPEYHDYGSGRLYCTNADVDHAGANSHIQFIEQTVHNKNRLLRYLFSEDSFVLTGNDNAPYGRNVDINVSYDHEEYYKGN